LSDYARATIRKDERVNIQISERDQKDCEIIAKREGLRLLSWYHIRCNRQSFHFRDPVIGINTNRLFIFTLTVFSFKGDL
jgi:hypothetical protein